MDEGLVAPAIAESLAALHDLLARFWAQVDHVAPAPPSGDLRARFSTAVIEIGGNIIRHAYPTGAPGTLALRLLAWPDRLEARYTDTGIRYIPQPAAPEAPAAWDDTALDALPEGGFGLALVRAAVDALDYERAADGVNHWTLTSRLG